MKREGLLQNKRWIIAIVMVCLAVCAIIWWIIGRNIPTENSEALYAVDVNNPRALVGVVDYTFVGVVESVEGTEYWWSDIPFTNYKIRVLHNIKGDLVLDSIPVTKDGGLSNGQTKYELYEDDFLPKPGDVCVFNAFAQDEGWLLLSGKNSNVLLFAVDYKQDMSSDALLEQVWGTEGFVAYQDGFAHQIASDVRAPHTANLDAIATQPAQSAAESAAQVADTP
jgi:hypothetical protein